jgi:hypothetical protein
MEALVVTLTVAQVLQEEHQEVVEALTVAQVLQVARAETYLLESEAMLQVIQAAQVEIAVTQYSTAAAEDKALTASKLAAKAKSTKETESNIKSKK